jgi:hypothetical protein
MEPIQPAQPMRPTDPTQPDQPVEAGQVVRPVRPVEPEYVPSGYVTRREPVERVGVGGRYPDPTAMRASQIVYFIFGIVEALIVIRIILKLLAANPNAGFSNLIYIVTNPLVAFFQGVFPEPQSNGSVLELSALLALVVYALLAWGIVRLIWIARRSGPPAEA